MPLRGTDNQNKVNLKMEKKTFGSLKMLAEYKIKNKTHPTQCPGNHLTKYIGLISCVS